MALQRTKREEPPERKNRVEIEAVDPETGRRRPAYLDLKKLEYAKSRGEAAVRELAFTVPEALTTFTHVFRGVREEGERDWLCYCARPSRRYDWKTGDDHRSPSDRVFLVFVTDEGYVYNWRWEKSDPTDPSRPENWQTRFDEEAL